jgi:hypothetical protein
MAKRELSPELAVWAKNIAQEVDSENLALAPMMLDAYLQGGERRKQLFKNDAMVGGFLAEGIVSLLVFAFSALSFIGNELMQLQASGGFDAINSLLSSWKTWLELLKNRESLNEKIKSPNGRNAELASLYRVSQRVEKNLQGKYGLSIEQSELVTYQVIKSLLEEPDQGAKLVADFPRESA